MIIFDTTSSTRESSAVTERKGKVDYFSDPVGQEEKTRLLALLSRGHLERPIIFNEIPRNR